ncbi:glycoside hydrolase family 2 TIM barrel-domain containing protein [Fictibacillus terranigra]|uniref:beta-galactosidase n=1 Tax=Fictibacillus terranigra TaxID=3058424 RepID=A0ABT8EDK3_9BACL|nr:glycoside hydrolase family 2 TIM barrel-domain containing protein [Fictibacillus sp. CENA-BCM004]MDN4075989.1 glycoside hydrolase family 2 TIM barrel-domain containing protein [Fictibacillus sp. CENA-BCM004]
MQGEENNGYPDFIWDWVDQQLKWPTPKGSKEKWYFAYGGDWSDKPNDDNFMANGLVSADRTLQPELTEIVTNSIGYRSKFPDLKGYIRLNVICNYINQ